MTEIAQRIEEIIREKSLSQKNFSRALGFTPGYMNDILRGRTTPSIRVVERISQIFNVSADWLLAGDAYRYGERRGKRWLDKVEVVTPRDLQERAGKFGRRRHDFVAVPLLNSTKLATLSGKAADITGYTPKEYCVVPHRRVKRPETTFCYRVRDKCMEPTIPAGSIVAVDSSVTAPSRLKGRLCAVRARPVPLIRRLRASKTYLVLEADSYPGSTKPIRIKSDATNPIIGRVEWVYYLRE